jgi:predicted enzyme related to lactoylglutathione lyase
MIRLGTSSAGAAYPWRIVAVAGEIPMNFNNVLIGSEDPKRLAAYYTKLFGEPAFKDDEGNYTGWIIGTGGITVAPHSEVKGSNSQPGRMLLNIETTDVQADFDRFKAAGATVIREPYTFEEEPGSWIATFADPDNNYFQLMTPMGPPEPSKA